MERDEVVIVECVLRLYPRIAQAMKQREEYIGALLRPQRYVKPVSGGEKIAEQDRYLARLEEDRQYSFLRGIVEPVRLAISELSPQEHRMVELHYFQCYPLSVTAKKLAYSVTYIQTLKTRCLFDLNCACASVYHEACAWRKMDSQERLENIRKQA